MEKKKHLFADEHLSRGIKEIRSPSKSGSERRKNWARGQEVWGGKQNGKKGGYMQQQKSHRDNWVLA